MSECAREGVEAAVVNLAVAAMTLVLFESAPGRCGALVATLGFDVFMVVRLARIRRWERSTRPV